MEIEICKCTHLRKCYVGFMLMTAITMQDTFHTTGLHNKRYKDNIQQLYEEFKEGGFSIRRTISKFNKPSPNQVIE